MLDRGLVSFPTYHLCLSPAGATASRRCTGRARRSRRSVARAARVWEDPHEQRQRGRGVQVQVLSHLSRGLRHPGDFEHAAEALDACSCSTATTVRPPPSWSARRLAARGGLARTPAQVATSTRRSPPSSTRATSIRSRAICGSASAASTSCASKLDAAERAYQRATLLPRGAFAFLALGRFHLHATGRLPEAATALAEAMRRLAGAEPLIRLELARLQLACGRPRAALAQAERALACRREGSFPAAADTTAAAGSSLTTAADRDAGVSRFSRALLYFPRRKNGVRSPRQIQPTSRELIMEWSESSRRLFLKQLSAAGGGWP